MRKMLVLILAALLVACSPTTKPTQPMTRSIAIDAGYPMEEGEVISPMEMAAAMSAAMATSAVDTPTAALMLCIPYVMPTQGSGCEQCHPSMEATAFPTGHPTGQPTDPPAG